jgi:hypothetical protein
VIMSGAAVSADLGSSSNYSGETLCLYLAGGPTSMLDKELKS